MVDQQHAAAGPLLLYLEMRLFSRKGVPPDTEPVELFKEVKALKL